MIEMQSINATEVRKNWSETCDFVARKKPSLIKRTHDILYFSSKENMLKLLSSTRYECNVYKEDDGSYTASRFEGCGFYGPCEFYFGICRGILRELCFV